MGGGGGGGGFKGAQHGFIFNFFLEICIHMIRIASGTFMINFVRGNMYISVKIQGKAIFYEQWQLPVSILCEVFTPYVVVKF